jgi:hypothetical protein
MGSPIACDADVSDELDLMDIICFNNKNANRQNHNVCVGYIVDHADSIRCIHFV